MSILGDPTSHVFANACPPMQTQVCPAGKLPGAWQRVGTWTLQSPSAQIDIRDLALSEAAVGEDGTLCVVGLPMSGSWQYGVVIRFPQGQLSYPKVSVFPLDMDASVTNPSTFGVVANPTAMVNRAYTQSPFVFFGTSAHGGSQNYLWFSPDAPGVVDNAPITFVKGGTFPDPLCDNQGNFVLAGLQSAQTLPFPRLRPICGAAMSRHGGFYMSWWAAQNTLQFAALPQRNLDTPIDPTGLSAIYQKDTNPYRNSPVVFSAGSLGFEPTAVICGAPMMWTAGGLANQAAGTADTFVRTLKATDRGTMLSFPLLAIPVALPGADVRQPTHLAILPFMPRGSSSDFPGVFPTAPAYIRLPKEAFAVSITGEGSFFQVAFKSYSSSMQTNYLNHFEGTVELDDPYGVEDAPDKYMATLRFRYTATGDAVPLGSRDSFAIATDSFTSRTKAAAHLRFILRTSSSAPELSLEINDPAVLP